jgi:hypothetical protein
MHCNFNMASLLMKHYAINNWTANAWLDHREEIYREETRGKLCHADIFSLLTIENYINSLFY